MNISCLDKKINTLFGGKRAVWVFQPKNVSLRLSDLLVYSYRAYRSEWGKTPTALTVGHATGLYRETVAAADRRLIGLGLLECDTDVSRPPANMFITKKKAEPDRHWRFSLSGWTCYIRQPGSPISILGVAAYSFLLHCAQTNFFPSGGITGAYLGKVLCANRHTLYDVLEKLQARKLLEWRDKTWIVKLPRTTTDLDFLQNKNARPARRPDVIVEDLPEGESPDIAPVSSFASTCKRYCRDDIKSALRQWSGHPRHDELYQRIVAGLVDEERDSFDWVEKLGNCRTIDKAFDLLSK